MQIEIFKYTDHQGQGHDMRLSLRELHEESQENEATWEFSNRRLLTQSASFGWRGILHLPPTSVIQVHCGRQLWYLFQHRIKKCDKLIHAYHDWDSDFVNDPKQWKAEVVVLEPSNVLFIQPGTLHTVVTLKNSIVRGQHFYTTTTLSKTVSGWVDTYIHGVKIERVLMVSGIENDSSKFKVNTAEGLLNIVALSNLLLSLPALDIVAIFNAHKPDAYGPLSEGRQAYFDIIYHLQEQKAQGWWKVYLKAFKQPTFFIWTRACPLDEWAVMVVKERVAEVMQSPD
ncbi:uncharacterized protein EV420DRAFT_1484936 [Desarmillaria tabescens]|uniref:JmjC domain-containing protein n=1 Tax=Armillaria tabescens TaxID=1929756 RepID=A0AA39JL96_ARMTA|nr:uncharacterized protein EV420DRAFT_1484936 [Desarmillaria tabescens]KAK0443409.1 hypothetical protein EV420DRAFT_1484936 [Desarmillaria tabescens]